MLKARFAIIIIGIFIPYLARLPSGLDWLMQYLQGGLPGILLMQFLNAITWGSILAWTTIYKRPLFLLFPAVAGFACAGYWHNMLDLGSDPNAAIGLIIIPFYTLVPIGIAGGVAYILDRFLKNNK